MIIHICQIIGACKIELFSNGIIKGNRPAHLACQRYVHKFYKELGFSEVVDYTHKFRKSVNLEVLGKHDMKIDVWESQEIPITPTF